MNLENLSDWIWFGVVAIWMLTRILPRLFRSKSPDASQEAAPRPRAPRPRAVRTSGQSISAPEMPGHDQDPEVTKRLRSSGPIDPH